MLIRKKEIIQMTNNEKTLLNLIREHEDSAEAVQIAISIIVQHLTPRGSSEEQAPAVPLESA